MNINFRRWVFWLHLFFGILSGLTIAILCLTGAILSFEKEILSLIERQDHITLEKRKNRLSIDELVKLANQYLEKEELRVISITAYQDAEAVWKVQIGRRSFRSIDPFTGRVFHSSSDSTREFFAKIRSWHRWLTSKRDYRSFGKSITGASNLCFFGLAITGLYLWLPRVWKWKNFLRAMQIKVKLRGKARDYNWHNALGFWAWIPIVIISLTGVIFSYSWARELLNQTIGPVPQRLPVSLKEIGAISLRGRPISFEKRFQIAISWSENWNSINLPTPSKSERGEVRGSKHGDQHQKNFGGRAGGQSQHGGGHGHQNRENEMFKPVSIYFKNQLFPLSPSRIVIHPRNGEIIGVDHSHKWSFIKKVRASIRGLHTGEALHLPGKIVYFLGCLASLIIIYTGFSLSWRRFL